MRKPKRRSMTSPSATAAASTSSRPTSATSQRSPSCWDGSARSCRRWPGCCIWRACSTMRLLSQQSLERFRTTLAPKAFGACHLDRLTKDDDLDFFIVSSSVSSQFGSPGQSNYATANALLDGLVAQRRAQRLARHRRQLRSVGAGRYGLLGGRDGQHQRPGPGATRSLGRAERARPRSSRTAQARRPSSRPTGSVPRRCSAVRVRRSSISSCRVRRER